MGWKIWTALAVILFGSVAWLALGGINWVLLGTAPIGWTTIGLSQADFRSTSNEFFTGPRWILTVVQGGMGQYAEGTISKEQIGSQSGEEPANDFAIKLDYSEQTCEYNIQKDTNAENIYIYTIHDFALGANPETECPKGIFWSSKYSWSFGGFCIEQTQITGAVEPNIESPHVRTKATIRVDKNGVSSASPEFNFDSAGNTQGWIGNNVYFVYNGDLIRNNCPDPDRYYAFYKYSEDGSGGPWRVGSSERYDTYKTTKIAVLNDLSSICPATGVSFSCTKEEVARKVNDLNNAANQADWFESFGTVENEMSLDGAKIHHNPGYFVNSPLHTFYVKADWLGVFQPEPNIIIQDAYLPDCINTYGNINIILRNDGESGNARISVSCQSPFSRGSNAREVYVASGTTITTYFPITVNTASPVTKSCTITVTDAMHTRTKTISVCANPENTCTPNDMVCIENRIEKCNIWGSGWDLYQQCGEDQICDYDEWGNPYCRDKNVPPPPPIQNPWIWLWIPILALLLGAVGYKGAGLIGGIIGGIAGGIAGYAVYWFMSLPWWAQLLLGIFGVAGTGIFIYIMLFGGGAIAVLALYAAVKR